MSSSNAAKRWQAESTSRHTLSLSITDRRFVGGDLRVGRPSWPSSGDCGLRALWVIYGTRGQAGQGLVCGVYLVFGSMAHMGSGCICVYLTLVNDRTLGYSNLIHTLKPVTRKSARLKHSYAIASHHIHEASLISLTTCYHCEHEAARRCRYVSYYISITEHTYIACFQS